MGAIIARSPLIGYQVALLYSIDAHHGCAPCCHYGPPPSASVGKLLPTASFREAFCQRLQLQPTPMAHQVQVARKRNVLVAWITQQSNVIVQLGSTPYVLLAKRRMRRKKAGWMHGTGPALRCKMSFRKALLGILMRLFELYGGDFSAEVIYEYYITLRVTVKKRSW